MPEIKGPLVGDVPSGAGGEICTANDLYKFFKKGTYGMIILANFDNMANELELKVR